MDVATFVHTHPASRRATLLVFGVAISLLSLQGCKETELNCGGDAERNLIKKIAIENKFFYDETRQNDKMIGLADRYAQSELAREITEIKDLYSLIDKMSVALDNKIIECGEKFNQSGYFVLPYCKKDLKFRGSGVRGFGEQNAKPIDLEEIKSLRAKMDAMTEIPNVPTEVVEFIAKEIKPDYDRFMDVYRNYQEKTTFAYKRIQIIKNDFIEGNLSKGRYSLSNIRFKSRNSENRSVTCESTLIFDTIIGERRAEIAYSIELTVDNKMYGTVYSKWD